MILKALVIRYVLSVSDSISLLVFTRHCTKTAC